MNFMSKTTFQDDYTVSRLAVSWLLIIPIFFFAARGTLWFQGGAANTEMAGGFSQLAKQNGSAGGVPVVGAMLLLVLVIMSSRLRSIIDACWKDKVFLVYGILAAVSSLWSHDIGKSFLFAGCMIVNMLFAFYLFRRFRQEQQMDLLLLSGWVIIVASIILAIFFPDYGVGHRGTGDGGAVDPWQGIFGHKNSCAVVVVYLLSAALFIPVPTLISKIYRGLYLLLALFLLFNTQSRTGWVLLACLLVYRVTIALIGKSRGKDRLVMATLFVTGAVLVGAVCAQYYSAIMFFIGKDPTLTGRTRIWSVVWSSIAKHPLVGYGYAGFWNKLQGESANVSLNLGFMASGVDNGYLNTWLELGSIGLLLFAYSLVRAFKDASLCLRTKHSSYINWCLSIIVLCVVSNVSEKMIMMPNYLPWIMYIVACAGLSNEATRIRLAGRNE
jgi:O-antigen ligase